MAEALITKADIIALKPRVSVNIIDADIIDQMILDAQRMDVRPAIGKAFYYEVVTNMNASPVPAIYTSLMTGTTYTRDDGLVIEYFGLKPAIINYTFARLLENLNLFFTRAGTKYKDSDNSTRVNNSELAAWVNTARSQAIAYMNEVNDYLYDQKALFPTWVSDCQIDRSRSVQSFANKKNPTNINLRFARSKKYY